MSDKCTPSTLAFLQAAVDQLAEGLLKIEHCVGQLDDAQVWWRPAPSMNSIANLLLHLSGNTRQWLIAGLSEVADTRQRQQEFEDRTGTASAELLNRLRQTVGEARSIILNLRDEQILRTRFIQEFEVTAAKAILDSVSHFCGHVQEIVNLTRLQLGAKYRFQFVPAAPRR